MSVVVALWSVACAQTEAPEPQGMTPPAVTPATGTETGPTGPGPTDDAPGAGRVQACELLTAGEIAAEVGAPFTEGVASERSTCNWAGEGGQLSASLTLAKSAASSPCTMVRPEGAQEVEGIGAEAWWEAVQAETIVGTLVACPEGYQMTLTLSGGGGEEASLRAAAEELAATVLGRL